MSKVLSLTGMLAVCVVFAGCAGKSVMLQGIRMENSIGVQNLSRGDYSVIGTAEGTGEATYIGLWPLPIFWVKGEGKTGGLFSMKTTGDCATATAMYKAIESVPNADALLLPKVHKDFYSFGIWYSKTKATVKGKAIGIKADEK